MGFSKRLSNWLLPGTAMNQIHESHQSGFNDTISLLHLPLELVEDVFRYLSNHELIHVSSTCRTLCRPAQRTLFSEVTFRCSRAYQDTPNEDGELQFLKDFAQNGKRFHHLVTSLRIWHYCPYLDPTTEAAVCSLVLHLIENLPNVARLHWSVYPNFMPSLFRVTQERRFTSITFSIPIPGGSTILQDLSGPPVQVDRATISTVYAEYQKRAGHMADTSLQYTLQCFSRIQDTLVSLQLDLVDVGFLTSVHFPLLTMFSTRNVYFSEYTSQEIIAPFLLRHPRIHRLKVSPLQQSLLPYAPEITSKHKMLPMLEEYAGPLATFIPLGCHRSMIKLAVSIANPRLEMELLGLEQLPRLRSISLTVSCWAGTELDALRSSLANALEAPEELILVVKVGHGHDTIEGWLQCLKPVFPHLRSLAIEDQYPPALVRIHDCNYAKKLLKAILKAVKKVERKMDITPTLVTGIRTVSSFYGVSATRRWSGSEIGIPFWDKTIPNRHPI